MAADELPLRQPPAWENYGPPSRGWAVYGGVLLLFRVGIAILDLPNDGSEHAPLFAEDAQPGRLADSVHARCPHAVAPPCGRLRAVEFLRTALRPGVVSLGESCRWAKALILGSIQFLDDRLYNGPGLFVLPKATHPPTGASQRRICFAVSLPVALEFRDPVVSVRLWVRPMLGT